MDAQAYLMRHGWSGPGNPLQPNTRPGPHGGLGLTRPILVSRKANNHGVGKKTTKDPTNQWWLRGFEDALKGVGDDSHEGVSARAGNALTSELYRNFVRGDGLAGTLNSKDDYGLKMGEKSKREGKEDQKETKEERRVRRAAKKERKEKRAVARVAKKERKDKRAVERAARRTEKEEKRAVKKAKKEAAEDYPTPMSIDSGAGSGCEKAEAEAKAEIVTKEKKEKKTKSDDDSKKSKKDKKEKKKSESKA
jgi:nucleolar protein TMA23